MELARTSPFRDFWKAMKISDVQFPETLPASSPLVTHTRPEAHPQSPRAPQPWLPERERRSGVCIFLKPRRNQEKETAMPPGEAGRAQVKRLGRGAKPSPWGPARPQTVFRVSDETTRLCTRSTRAPTDTLHEREQLRPRLYLLTMKSEFHILFACHKILLSIFPPIT